MPFQFGAVERLWSWYLWLALVVIIAGLGWRAYRWFQERRSVVTVPGEPYGVRFWLREHAWRTVCECVAILALIAIPMDPQWRGSAHIPEGSDVGVIVALDASASMTAEQGIFGSEEVERGREGGAYGRMWGVKKETEAFVRRLGADIQLGLVIFSNDAYPVAQLSSRRDAFLFALATTYAPNRFASSGTNLVAALEEALVEIRAHEELEGAAVVVMSDGERNEVETSALELILADYRNANVPIYTVAVGVGPAPVPNWEKPGTFLEGEISRPDPEFLRSLAAATGGEAYAYREAGTLGEILGRALRHASGERWSSTRDWRSIRHWFFAVGSLFLVLPFIVDAVLFRLRRYKR